MYVCIDMFTNVETDLPKLRRVHIGHVRPKRNDAAVVY